VFELVNQSVHDPAEWCMQMNANEIISCCGDSGGLGDEDNYAQLPVYQGKEAELDVAETKRTEGMSRQHNLVSTETLAQTGLAAGAVNVIMKTVLVNTTQDVIVVICTDSDHLFTVVEITPGRPVVLQSSIAYTTLSNCEQERKTDCYKKVVLNVDTDQRV
jgi:hypothetical protein